MKKYDVIIIGAGTAGLSAQREVSSQSDNYLVVDPGPLGTTCARVGCMPSKVLIEAVNVFHQRLKFSRIGVEPHQELKLDSEILLQHVRKLRDQFVRGVTSDIETWKQTHLAVKKARFVSSQVLDLEGEPVSAKKFIIATGTSPFVPPNWKNLKDILTTDSLFDLPALPKKMAVIGLGPIGLEMSQALARAGVQVSVFAFGSDNIGGGLTDPDLVSYAKKIFTAEMTIFDERVMDIKSTEKGLSVESSQRKIEVDKVLVAIGRKPNLTDLGLENFEIEWDSHKIPLFSKETFRIKNTNIYLVGDVNGERPFLHEAAEQGRIAGYNSLLEQDQPFRLRTRLAITFSSPQIALVGKSHQDLIEEKADFVEGSVSFENQGRAVAKMENSGMLKVFGHRQTGLILGAEIFAPEGEHLAHLLAWSMETNCSVFEVLNRPVYHPVLEEGLRRALRRMSEKVEKKSGRMDYLLCEDPPAGTWY
jgi:dihydrolipoamide dehydrogenase